jgi:hypothetical protein
VTCRIVVRIRLGFHDADLSRTATVFADEVATDQTSSGFDDVFERDLQ